jgi:pyruvate,water dikinase
VHCKMNLLANFKAALIEKSRKTVPFTDLFSRFREALDDHNRAIELIADMGEKLSGDYLFDISYLKSAYAELRIMLTRSLSSFAQLTGNRYAGLMEVYDRIDKSIRSLIFDESALSGDLVMSYDSITWSMIREAGGKNANLAEIRNNLGLTVPEAFAVTAYSFNEFMRHNGIDRYIADLDTESSELSRKLAAIRKLIMSGSMPAVLTDAIEQAVSRLDSTGSGDCFLAIRSSAEGEDSGFSFAGQFETVLNVPCRIDAVQEAYKRVIASLFSDKAVAYQKQVGGDVRIMRMAVGCLRMVEASVSGVVYTADPSGKKAELLISATWGLGKALVEGNTDTDMYTVERNSPFAIKAKRIGRKTSMVSGNEKGGTSTADLSAERAESECLTVEQVRDLARQAMAIENYFRRPVDVEWAIDREGKVFILQARQLRMVEDSLSSPHSLSSSVDAQIVAKLDGLVVHQGVGAGRVFVVRDMDDLGSFPRGAVLVSRNDASDFIRIMPYVSAIITDIGSLTSHMASLCREFRVPTIVNTGNATSVLEDGKEVTVVIEDDGPVIYEGVVRKILDAAGSTALNMEDLYDFRKKRYVLRYISQLNLLDPLRQSFAPEECRTLHDILRFIHEKAVMELLDRARNGLKTQGAIPLDLPVPASIMVVDIGGGLHSSNGEKRKRITFDQIASFPFRALLEGMMHPGVWRTDPVPLTAGDFMASMMRIPDFASDSSYVGYNIAVISREYVNLSLRFGYHYAMLDCYCSEHTRDNHLYFRFAGGATDMAKRSRRIQFIADVLKKFGFALRIKGDLIIARLSNIRKDELQVVLDQTGRLLAYTRQLDAVMHDDRRVGLYVNNFLEGRYEFEAFSIDNK